MTTHPTPTSEVLNLAADHERLVARLRMLADEIESAARYGVPIPFMVSVSGHKYGAASFAATAAEFDAWAEYTEAPIKHYAHAGQDWRRVDVVDVNGLPLSFATSESPTLVASLPAADGAS